MIYGRVCLPCLFSDRIKCYERGMTMSTPMEKPVATKPVKRNTTWLYLAIPALIIAVVVFHYGKGFLQEKQADKVIGAYVEQTYGDKLDKFQYSMGDHVTIAGLSSKVTAYHRYYYQQDLWGGGFQITADLDGNIVYDGYKDWYLLGGTVIEHAQSLYQDDGYKIKDEIYSKAIQDGLFDSKDKFTASVDLVYKTKGAEGGYGNVLVEPQLDPEKEYDTKQLAADYGEVFICLKTDRSTPDDFARYAQFCANWLKNTEYRYNTAVIYMAPDKDEDIRYRAVTLTKDEISTADIGRLVAEKAFVYTNEDMQKDANIINGGADWPRTYRYAFVGRIQLA